MIGLLLRAGVIGGLLALLSWGGQAVWREATRTPVDATRPLTSAVPTAAVAAQMPSLTKPPLATFSDTLKRPMFFEGRSYPERRPVAVTTAPVAPAVVVAPQPQPQTTVKDVPPPVAVKPATTEGLKLLGVLVNKGQSRALIEVEPQAGEWLSVGAKIRDWTIESISADRVALRQGRQTATLELYALSPTYPRQRTR